MERSKAASIRVERGARWLDENFPGWEDRIDVDTLELCNPRACICGQVFADEIEYTGSLDSNNGYGFAQKTLFSEANHWISEIVKSSPLPYDEDDGTRSELVARALGFEHGYVDTSGAPEDAALIEYHELQEAWLNLLAGRAES